jgi:hypothetical protein
MKVKNVSHFILFGFFVFSLTTSEAESANGGIRNFKFRKKNQNPTISNSKPMELRRYHDGE